MHHICSFSGFSRGHVDLAQSLIGRLIEHSANVPAINVIDLTAKSNQHGTFDGVRAYNLAKLGMALAVFFFFFRYRAPRGTEHVALLEYVRAVGVMYVHVS
jgi:hypothetical protein